MGLYLLLGVVLLGVLLLLGRAFTQATPAQLAHGVRVFAAAFSALASTGLLFAGRFGLAIVAIGATVVAIHALRSGSPAGGFGGDRRGGRSSEVETDTLRMELDHASGTLEGEVKRGRFAGRSLESLGLSDLLDLLADCQREDPRAVALLETYLDRRQPDWRAHVAGGGAEAGEEHAARGDGPMDEATARQVLGLSPGASAAEIKSAHRRLMTRLHPDHGGSSYLAAQLNEAKELLLKKRR